jgi:hypothetical protein
MKTRHSKHFSNIKKSNYGNMHTIFFNVYYIFVLIINYHIDLFVFYREQ